MITMLINRRDFVEVAPDTELRVTKTLDALDSFGIITQEAALSVTLTPTSANRRALSGYHPTALNPARGNFAVEIRRDGRILDLTAGRIVRYSERDGYEVELFGEDWQDELGRTRLRDLDLGRFGWYKSDVIDLWQGRQNPLAMPVLARYGGFRQDVPGSVSMRDLRLWFNVGGLLSAAFRHIGWTLDCPHLTVGDGRWWYAYLSPERWHTYRSKKAPGFVALALDDVQPSSRLEDPLPWEVLENPDGNWAEVGFGGPFQYIIRHDIRTGRLQINFELDLDATLPPSESEAVPELTVDLLVHYDNDRATLATLGRWAYSGGVNTPRVISEKIREYIELDVPPSVLPDGQVLNSGAAQFELFFSYFDDDGDVPFTIDRARLTYRPDPKHYAPGPIDLADLLDPELSGRDLLEGVAQLMNGKVTTDNASRTVSLRPPFDYAYDGATVIGFYDRTADLDLILRQVPGSFVWTPRENEAKRYQLYGFDDEQDAYVSQTGASGFDRTVDLGRGEPETNEHRNGLFQPTARRTMLESEVGGVGLFVLTPADNQDGEVTHDIGRRVAIWHGRTERGSWVFEGKPVDYTPLMAMDPHGTDGLPLTFSGYTTDLYERFYRREANDAETAYTVEVLTTGGDEVYESVTFRNPILVEMDGGTMRIQPRAVRDHEWGSVTPLLIEGQIIK